MKTLYRPVGPKELKLICDSGWTKFPPRLPDQSIFYPVFNRNYACRISKEWNVPLKGIGFVVAFEVDDEYLELYKVHQVGDPECLEYWIPAEELEEFNNHIHFIRLLEVHLP